MDRLIQLRGQAGGSRECGTAINKEEEDSTLDTSSLPSEAYVTANDSSKYFSLSEEDSTFDIAPIKHVSLTSTANPSKAPSDELISNLSPIPKNNDLLDYKFGKQIEAANILSGGVNIFDDNDNSFDGEHELVIDDNTEDNEKSSSELKHGENEALPSVENDAIVSNDTEVVLQIDGKNVKAIDIGNGLYLYRKEGGEELAAVQIVDDEQQQPSFKFLKVRENAEGNLEVYEEIEVLKELPAKEGKTMEKVQSIIPEDINKANDTTSNKSVEKKLPEQEAPTTSKNEINIDPNKDAIAESKTELNLNGEIIKYNETRKSPVIHSTPNKEGVPLTKTMVNQQLHPNRHSDNVKTIELHTDSKNKQTDMQIQCNKEVLSENKTVSSNDSCTQEKAEKSVDITKESVLQEAKESAIKLDDSKVTEERNIQGNKQLSEKNTVHDKRTESDQKKDEIKNQDIVLDITKDKIVSKIDSFGTGDKLELNVGGRNDEKETIDKNKNDFINSNIVSTKISSICSQGNTDKFSNRSIDFMDPCKLPEKQINVLLTNYESKPENTDKFSNPPKDAMDPGKIIGKHNDSISVVETKLPEKQINLLTNNENKPIENESCALSTLIGNKIIQKEASLNKDEHGAVIEENNIKNMDISKYNDYNLANTDKNIMGTKFNPVLAKEKESYDDTANIEDTGKQNKILVVPGKEDVIEKVVSESGNVEGKKTLKLEQKPIEVITNLNLLETVESKEEVNLKQKVDVKNANITKMDPNIPKQKTETIDYKTEVLSEKASKIEDVPTLIEEEIRPHNRVEHKELQKKLETIVISKQVPNIVKITAGPGIAKSNPLIIKENVSGSTSITKNSVTFKTIPKKTINKPVNEIVVNVPQKQSVPKLIAKAQSTTKSASTSNLQESFVKFQESSRPETTHRNVHNIAILNQKIFSKVMPPVIVAKQIDNKTDIKKDNSKVLIISDSKSVNNNNAPVPFGKWTEANRQAFVNKIMEPKIPTNTFNAKQIKQPNDLNRRDILQKIDSQRQSHNAVARLQEIRNTKLNVKTETKTFINNPVPQERKMNIKPEEPGPATKVNQVINKKQVLKPEAAGKLSILKDLPNTVFSSSTDDTKEDPNKRKEINNQDLIDRTIEDMINKDPIPMAKSSEEVSNPPIKNEKLVAMEKKMNELHGKPFVERAPHELPKIKTYGKSEKIGSKINKIPNLLPFTNKNQPLCVKDDHVQIDSDDEVIEHEPITGDIGLNKNIVILPNTSTQSMTTASKTNIESSKSGNILRNSITETEFDKFARRNSITYENQLTVNFDSKQPCNVIETLVEKEVPIKKISRNEMLLAAAKVKSSHKHSLPSNKHSNTIQIQSKLVPVSEEALSKTYPSKWQVAYQSALTAKQQKEPPITIIEDKPVKVLFMDYNAEFQPSQLNAQGSQLSPTKRLIPEPEFGNDTVDSDILESIGEGKSQDDSKVKVKHQRKQVLTPVETPDLELIEPADLKISEEVTHKKKRKTEDGYKMDKQSKHVLSKKTYLLNRTVTDDKPSLTTDVSNNLLKETPEQSKTIVSHNDAASAIDSLVKAAEFVETQSEKLNSSSASIESSTSQGTPMKRGRGRPRKYPLPEGSQDKAKLSPSPQKRPRLIDAKKPKETVDSDDDSTSEDEIIMENWTMGKINEKIVCPICSKLFRSENVVFKHVKHCTGPSPNRSDSDKRSSRKSRNSGDSGVSRESKSEEEVYTEKKKYRKRSPKKRISKLTSESSSNKDDVIVIDDSPVTENSKQNVRRRPGRPRIYPKIVSNACEICGKTFRQASYLAHHKRQHIKNDAKKKAEKEVQINESVFVCEICKKKFRKLHHLVQHRLIHNQSAKQSPRKSSSEQSDIKSSLKEQETSKSGEDHSAAFRCEPCDKSFRKLHHLVEHRETHDGINRQKNANGQTMANIEKPLESKEPPQCDICKKTFRKLHHLIEHKEQHNETSSEKSDNKSVRSSLSTRDIIHECSLCYMVFPNEHSLTKHTVICQRKKKQSAVKAKQAEGTMVNKEENDISPKSVTNKEEPQTDLIIEKEEEKGIIEIDKINDKITNIPTTEKLISKIIEKHSSKESSNANVELVPKPPVELVKPIEHIPSTKLQSAAKKRDGRSTSSKKEESAIPFKIKKLEEKPKELSVENVPKKKIVKDKLAASVTKRRKSSTRTLATEAKISTPESSDDDEVRYMLNPDFKVVNDLETTFMKIRADKRNSLQVERPNSKDLVTRRISLQHPPKAPRLKSKPVEARTLSANTTKSAKLQSVPSIDSDDSDVKYSFPVKVTDKIEKSLSESKPKEVQKTPKEKKKAVLEKRRALNNIPTRKSLNKIISSPVKDTSPARQIKKRISGVEHRCDCGELFSSAALLSRHTTLAHTPPRIRRRRSPPPAPAPRSSSAAARDYKTNDTRKPSARSDLANTRIPRKSLIEKKTKSPKRKLKSDDDTVKRTTSKTRRSVAHRGVPVPEKLKNLLEKSKK